MIYKYLYITILLLLLLCFYYSYENYTDILIDNKAIIPTHNLVNPINNLPNKNKWAVLITSCVNLNQSDRDLNQNSSLIADYRKNLYINKITKWLTYTKLPIYVVESSGYNFSEIKHDRLVVFSFTGSEYLNSSFAEAKSIEYALEKLDAIDNDYTHILKVTGKYYLDGIEKILDNLPDNYDLYTQQYINHEERQANTEYYGIRKNLYLDFIKTCSGNMETDMYNFMSTHNSITIPVQFSNNVIRGAGDIINPL